MKSIVKRADVQMAWMHVCGNASEWISMNGLGGRKGWRRQLLSILDNFFFFSFVNGGWRSLYIGKVR